MHFFSVLFSAIVGTALVKGEKYSVLSGDPAGDKAVRSLFEEKHRPLYLVSSYSDEFGNRSSSSSSSSSEDKTVTVGLFHFPPFTFETTGADGAAKRYSGAEVSLVKVIIKSLGMKPIFQTPSDGKNNWGERLSNGTWTGLVGDIYQGVVDVGMAEFFNKANKIGYMDPSEFYLFDHFCFVRKKPEPYPQFLQLMMPFGPLVWLGVLASLLFSVFFLALVSWASSGEMVEVGKAPGISLSVFVMQDSRFGKARACHSTEIYFIIMAGLGGILSMAYSGVLISFLTLRVRLSLDHDIESLNWFSGSHGTTGKGDAYHSLLSSKNPEIRKLANKYVTVSGWQEGMDLADQGKYAYMSSKISTDYVMQENFTDRTSASESSVEGAASPLSLEHLKGVFAGCAASLTTATTARFWEFWRWRRRTR